MPPWRLLCPPLGPFAHNPVNALRQCLQDAIHVGKMCTQDWSVSAKFAYSPHNKCCGDFSLRTHEQPSRLLKGLGLVGPRPYLVRAHWQATRHKPGC